ncbi:MAG: hypothetical protein EOP07_08070 [Proteobacteria bacterium]|nr:MAG: hypothetical protein EOP07_08070 [Pseudomonadota bacterium]
MKLTKPLISCFILASTLSFGCKQKKIVTAPAPVESTAPLLKSDVWQGTSDQVDPQLGKIKALD